MFHLPGMTLAFPLRGVCQHNSSCHRTFAQVSNTSLALCTCSLPIRGDVPSRLAEWTHVLVSCLIPTSQGESIPELSWWEDSMGPQPQDQASLWRNTVFPPRLLSLNPNGSKCQLSWFPGQLRILAFTSRKKMGRFRHSSPGLWAGLTVKGLRCGWLKPCAVD